MHIFIPTLGRVGKQVTLGQIPFPWLDRTWLVCPHGEEHEEQYISTPEGLSGIGHTRQWIADHCRNMGIPSFFMFDDDLKFARRKEAGGKLEKCTNDDMDELLKRLEKILESGMYCQMGVGNVYLSHNRQLEEDGGRLYNCHGYNTVLLHESGARFDRMPLMEDFDATLTLLRNGYLNRCTFEWVQSDCGANAPGGCSTYRNAELQTKAAHMLKEFHPDYVRIREKTVKGGWEGMKTRTDVVISWQKARKAGALARAQREA